MYYIRKFCLAIILCLGVLASEAQVIGFRLAANSGMFISELGEADLVHPNAFALTPATSSEKFTPQLSVGLEGEVLFQVSPMSHIGIELEYSKLKGYNDDPPYYNYYLTPYFNYFQEDYTVSPVAFNTSLINVAVNWKYFFFQESELKPFVKLTGVVSFVATDFTIKNSEDATGLDSNVLYARGTSNTEQDKWPAFHFGGGAGFDYRFSEHWSFQIDGTVTVINSDIINGAPNFTYAVDESLLKHNKRPSLTMQISAGLVYSIEVSGRSGKGGRGKTDPNLPFYRKK